MNTITVSGKTYTMTGEAEITYRSHINGMQCTCPNNWVALPLVDADGNEYTAWYYMTDTNAELNSIDYDSPSDLTDEDGKIVFDAE